MPWHQKTKKDVAACEKPREGGKQPVIRGSPNGETHCIEDAVSLCLTTKVMITR